MMSDKKRIEELINKNFDLEHELEKQDELISCLRWFCLKMSLDLDISEKFLIKKVALKLFNMIDDKVDLVSFKEFIGE